jgi:hypothetical protein
MNADFEGLRKYCDIKARLHTLQTEIVGDTAKDYSSGYPHSIMLRGLACDDKTQKEVKLLCQELNVLDSLVDGISDVRAKNLVDLHYRKGMTWRQISRSTGRDSEAERQYLCRFLKKF